MSDRPIFVVGCPRSGTTMLQLMLHSHPRVAVAPETRFVLPAYQKRRAFGDMRRPERRRALAEWIATDRSAKFKELGIGKDSFIRQAEAAPGSLGSVLGTAFEMYAERFGKARWGDKRPSYVKHVDTLRRLFPDAQFVHLIRDGRDCVASLKEMPWFTHSSYHAISTWAEAIDYGRRLRRTLPADTYYELRYEDLTADPAGEMRKLCAFLGEEFDPSVVSPKEAADEVVPLHKVWHGNTHSEVTRARVGSWATRLEDWEIALCEEELGERLQANGYELSGAPKPAKEQLARLHKVMQKRHRSRTRKAMLDRLARLREPGPVAAMLTGGQRALAGFPQQRSGVAPAAQRAL
ncbi:sulfotransferase family protein [Thermoactinospora rubra]|uniref:sulfotransferase family protein n=1 Tax=Thermoactinospora rubra TaxID=1088767 RepID=UPI000A0FF974|nr:sulfotransferase [Thermoactinospora rubra]